MRLSMSNYDILNLTHDALVVSDRGISKISSPPLLNALSRLKNYSTITRSELDEILTENGLNPETAYTFLESAISIRPAYAPHFEKVFIIHDWKGAIDLEKLLREEIKTPLEFHKLPFTPSAETIEPNKKYYILIIPDYYNYHQLHNLHFSLASQLPESAISVCHHSCNSYHISQPYIPAIGNPCHFCNIGRMIHYENQHTSTQSWSKLLTFCGERRIPIPNKRLSLLQEALVLGALIKKIGIISHPGDNLCYQDNILQTTLIDFNNNHIDEYTPPHWHLCDCLRIPR